MPIELRFNFSYGSDSVITVWNDQQIQQYTFSFNRQVVSIDFDPDEWILRRSFFVTDISEDDITNPVIALTLNQNYPNPFNPLTKINYSVSHTSNVVIKVYDVLGNEIETLVNEEKQRGSYEIIWDAEGLPSGIYFYRLQAIDTESSSGQVFVETKKMLLLK